MTRLTTEDLYKASYIESLSYPIGKFQREVFLTGLQDAIDKELIRGQKAVIGSYDVLTYEIAGRVLVTFRGSGCEITLITTDKQDWQDRDAESPPGSMGIQSLDGECQEIIYMIDFVIANWDLSKLQPYREVKLG